MVGGLRSGYSPPSLEYQRSPEVRCHHCVYFRAPMGNVQGYEFSYNDVGQRAGHVLVSPIPSNFFPPFWFLPRNG